MEQSDAAVLMDEQVAYYRARAPEYDEWWHRVDRDAAEDELARRWEREQGEVLDALEAFAPRGAVLELAAGTGNFTCELSRLADEVTAVDTSPEALDIARSKLAVAGAPVTFVVADLFEWTPPRRYDVVFFSFWLTHVPLSRFDDFWHRVDLALEPDGRVFFIDNVIPLEDAASELRSQTETPPVTTPWSQTDIGEGVSIRELKDGRRFHIIKQFWHPDDLGDRLAEAGWHTDIRTTETAFIYGSASRTP